MKASRWMVRTVVSVAVVGVVATGIAVAAGKVIEHKVARKISTALQKAGVEQAKIDAILEQAHAHRGELIGIWKDQRSGVRELAEMDSGSPEAVRGKVVELFQLHDRSRDRLRSMVEQLGRQLTTQEKARLVLNFSERLEKLMGGGVCGARAELLAEKISESDRFTPRDQTLLQAQLEQAVPEMCAHRDTLKSDLDALHAALDQNKASELETLFNRLKADHEAAARTRREIIQETLAQLSPEAQIGLAQRALKLHDAAELLLGL